MVTKRDQIIAIINEKGGLHLGEVRPIAEQVGCAYPYVTQIATEMGINLKGEIEERVEGRHRRVLRAIAALSERDGFPPTMREVAKVAGVSSTSLVLDSIEVLEWRGLLKRHPMKTRAVILTEKGKLAASND